MSDSVQGLTRPDERPAEQLAGPEKEGGRKVFRRLSESLSEDQQRALGLLTEGTPIREVGQQLGIHRGTIYRWLKSDPYFRAAYNAWQLEQQESCRAALIKAAERAVARVIEMIPVDAQLAWRVIKEMGILARPPRRPLSTDPSRVEREIAVEDHEEESELLRRIEQELEGDLPTPRGDLKRVLSVQWEKAHRNARPAGHEPEPEPPAGAPHE